MAIPVTLAGCVQETVGVLLLLLLLRVRASWVPPLGCPNSSKQRPCRFS